MVAVAAAAMLALAAGCGGGSDDSPEARNTAVVEQAADEAAIRQAALDHLVANGAELAERDGPMGYWSAGDVYLPDGGPSCSVAEVFVGDAAGQTVNAVLDESGTVAVKVSSTADDKATCLQAAAAALEGFSA